MLKLLCTINLLTLGSCVKFIFEEEVARQQKSLLNTFPFNQQENHHSSSNHHGFEYQVTISEIITKFHLPGEEEESTDQSRNLSNRKPQTNLDARDSLQGSDFEGISFNEVAQSTLDGGNGKKCIDKVDMVEETEYDEVIKCDHSYDRRCHISYITDYISQQELECEENFVKNCFIDYEQVAFNETVRVCRNPLVKDCEVAGPEVCRTIYESECWTKQEEHNVEDDVVDCRTEVEEKCNDETVGYTTRTKCSKWPKEVCSVSKKKVKKFTPVTGCNKEPRELCAPAGCGFKQVRCPGYVVHKGCFEEAKKHVFLLLLVTLTWSGPLFSKQKGMDKPNIHNT